MINLKRSTDKLTKLSVVPILEHLKLRKIHCHIRDSKLIDKSQLPKVKTNGPSTLRQPSTLRFSGQRNNSVKIPESDDEYAFVPRNRFSNQSNVEATAISQQTDGLQLFSKHIKYLPEMIFHDYLSSEDIEPDKKDSCMPKALSRRQLSKEFASLKVVPIIPTPIYLKKGRYHIRESAKKKSRDKKNAQAGKL
jgi:hypothetical protein